jgi:hypothetical protein
MKSELGSVDPGAVKKAFHTLDDPFMECQKRGLERIEVLAGNVKFFLRIGEDGAAKWAYVEESDLGDRATEKCLITAIMSQAWPKPDGGDAEAHYGIELPLQATRPPVDWGAEKVSARIGKYADAIDRCKGGASGFQATIYVGQGGTVIAAGVATAHKDSEEQADCLADLLVRAKGLPSPGSWPAKVSLPL